MDDNHKACNKKFASILGFKSSQEWAEKQGFLEAFVNEKSCETLSSAYWQAIKKKAASTIPMTWIKKDGAAMDSRMILVPMFFEGHMFSFHFVTSTSIK